MTEAEEDVYLPGAGATKADFKDVPLGNELLHAILIEKERVEILMEFLETIFDDDCLKPSTPPDLTPRIDDIFTLIDASLTGRAPAPARARPLSLADVYDLHNGAIVPRLETRWPPEHLLKVRGALVAAIARVISNSIRDLPSPLAKRFVAGLDARRGTIISTNYDIVMDDALYRAGRLHYGVAVRMPVKYTLPPMIAAPDPEQAKYFYPFGEQLSWATGLVRLLKLHGSLNWLYCPRCDELDITLSEEGGAYILQSPTIGRCAKGSCTSRYEALLVGPSLDQRYEHRILSETWQRAEEALRRAQRLIIIGYSLPEADYLIRAMLARSFSKRSSAVTVFNGGPNGKPKDVVELESRYRRLFPHCKMRWDGFEGLVGELEHSESGSVS